MKTYIIYVLFMLLSIGVQAQKLTGQALIDSLLLELPLAKEDSNGVRLFRTLSFEYSRINPEKGIEYGEMSLDMAKQIGWNTGIASSYIGLGVNYSRLSDYPKALEVYKNAAILNEEIGNMHDLASSLTGIGNVYYFLSDFPKSLEYYHRSRRLNEELGYKSGLATNLLNIAIIYTSISDYPKALDFYFQAKVLNEEIGNKRFHANVLGSIGVVYYNQADYLRALEYFHESRQLNENLNNKSGLAFNLGNIGNAYSKLSDFSTALEYLQQAYDLNEELGQIAGLANNTQNFGRVHYSLLNYAEALKYFKSAYKLHSELGSLSGKSITLNFLSEVNSEMGNHQEALEYYKEYKTLQDSIFSVEKSTAIANLEAKRENELKDREIALLSSEKQVQFLELEGKKAQLALQNLESDRQMQAIDLLNKDNEIYLLEIGQKDQELLLSQMANEAQATQLELAILEREVKDAELMRQKTIRQSMLAGFGLVLLAGLVLFFFLMYRRRTKFKEKVAVTELKALRAQMNPHFMFNALGSIHNFVMQNDNEKASAYLLKFSRLMRIILESSMKENITLEEEIEALEIYMQLEAARMQHQFTFDFAISDKIDRSNTIIPPLLIQPFVENAIWHGVSNRSSPGHVSVKISKQGDILHCEIEDNGIGRQKAMEINQTQVNKRESVGIKLTLERIEIINRQKRTKGGVSFTDLEEGLRVDIDLPMEEVY